MKFLLYLTVFFLGLPSIHSISAFADHTSASLNSNVQKKGTEKVFSTEGLSYWENDSPKATTVASSALISTPKILSAVANQSAVYPGETITITVTANSYTKAVRLKDQNDQIIHDNGSYTSSNGQHIFKFSYQVPADLTDSRKLSVVPGTGKIFYENNRISLAVSASNPKLMEILSFVSDKYTLHHGDKATLTIIANNQTNRVKILNNQDQEEVILSDYKTVKGQRQFSCSVSTKNKKATKYTAYAGNQHTYSNDGKSILLSEKNSTALEIISVHVTAKKQRFEIKILTSNNVTQLVLKDSFGNFIASETTSHMNGNQLREWKLTCDDSYSGNSLTLYAYGQKNSVVKKTFNLEKN